MIKESCKTCSVGVPPGQGLGTTSISNKTTCSFFTSKNYIFYIALQYLMSYYIYYRFSPYIATELPIYQLHFLLLKLQYFFLLHFTVEIPYICKNDHRLQLKPSLTNWRLDKALAGFAWPVKHLSFSTSKIVATIITLLLCKYTHSKLSTHTNYIKLLYLMSKWGKIATAHPYYTLTLIHDTIRSSLCVIISWVGG